MVVASCQDYNVMRDVRIGLGIFMILCSLWGIKTAFVSALGEKVQVSGGVLQAGRRHHG